MLQDTQQRAAQVYADGSKLVQTGALHPNAGELLVLLTLLFVAHLRSRYKACIICS